MTSEPVSQYLTEHPDTVSSIYVSASFMLRNYGKGPAVIETILGRIAVVKSIDTVSIGDFNECEKWVHSRGVLGVGESVQVLSPVSAALGIQNAKAGWIEPDSVNQIIKNQAVLVVYGQVAYRDFFDTLFLSDFCWFYSNMAFGFGANLPSHGFAIQGPKERNRYHQEDTGLSEPE